MITSREFAFVRHMFSMPMHASYYKERSLDLSEPTSDTGYYSPFFFNDSNPMMPGYKSSREIDFLGYHEPTDLTADVALDLSFKPSTPITPPSTPSPTSPSQTKKKERESSPRNTPLPIEPSLKKIKVSSKRHKAVRKLTFDEEKTSPVSGTIIRELRDDEPPLVVRKGDIDPAFNLVEVTEEAKAELAKIENKIGDYICRLCKEMYEDAFALAQHRCSRIVHVDYRCPECDKVFNCPANLASHRRWHKPRGVAKTFPSTLGLVKKMNQEESDGASSDSEAPFACHICQKRFRRQAYLRKHVETHQSASETLLPSESFGNFDLRHSLLTTGN
ncbi:hypothetical protein RUM44_001263 [Polyplax serrata]|uniref:C2H2-type domain-containing protein n=1 Tax=Polyplax serrata TaxID=468196 RepID=A0ABR1AJK6_POLSC